MKVWRPQGFAGVEVERFDNVKGLSFPLTMMAAHEITVVHSSGESTPSYERQPHRFKADNLYLNQHVGALCSWNTLDDISASVWTLRFYPEAMQQLKADLGLSESFSYFPEVTAPKNLNTSLANLTIDAILAFDEPAFTLERESKLLGLIYAVLKHCSDTPPSEQKLGKEHKAVSLVKEALHSHPDFDHRLEDLAALTKLNKYYLWEVFKRDVGLSPDQYQTYLRVSKAKDLLAKGTSVVQTALDTGFSDQSHLNRVFKKYVQVTPGKFQRDTLNAA